MSAMAFTYWRFSSLCSQPPSQKRMQSCFHLAALRQFGSLHCLINPLEFSNVERRWHFFAAMLVWARSWRYKV